MSTARATSYTQDMQYAIHRDPQSQIIIRQRAKNLLGNLGLETRNEYDIIFADGSSFGYAAEPKGISGVLRRLILNRFGLGYRTFQIEFFNTKKEKVFIAYFRYKRIFIREIEIKDPNGTLIGTIRSSIRFTIMANHDCEIKDATGNLVAHAYNEEGSWFFRMFNTNYIWRNPMGQKIASVRHRYQHNILKMLINQDENDEYQLQFHTDRLTGNIKILLLAAVFHIDIKHFEHTEHY